MTQMPPKVDVPRAAPVPPAPVTLADTGLTADKVEALIVKTLYAGEMSGLQLAESLRLPYPILEPIIERARGERQRPLRPGSRIEASGIGLLQADAKKLQIVLDRDAFGANGVG